MDNGKLQRRDDGEFCQANFERRRPDQHLEAQDRIPIVQQVSKNGNGNILF